MLHQKKTEAQCANQVTNDPKVVLVHRVSREKKQSSGCCTFLCGLTGLALGAGLLVLVMENSKLSARILHLEKVNNALTEGKSLRVMAGRLDSKTPGIWVRGGDSEYHSGFYPMPRIRSEKWSSHLAWHAIYDSVSNTDGVEVSAATGGMDAIEGFYKRFSSTEIRPFHFSNYAKMRGADSEARKVRSWIRNCKKGLPKGASPREWYMNRNGRCLFYDGRQWVMTQDINGGVSTMSIYHNESKSAEIPRQGWMPESRGGPDENLTFTVTPVSENPSDDLENAFALGEL